MRQKLSYTLTRLIAVPYYELGKEKIPHPSPPSGRVMTANDAFQADAICLRSLSFRAHHLPVPFRGPTCSLPRHGRKQHLQPLPGRTQLSPSLQDSLSALGMVAGMDRSFRWQPCGHTGQPTANKLAQTVHPGPRSDHQEGTEQQPSVLRILLCAWGYHSPVGRAS